ncbi:MAG: DUF4386 domain-containing protein [Richelia sp. RM2_1_2]|nr:DUF4386 domain-containing protein [Richelia sp. SM2_1_7]NJM18981.1 DUF4386 domain-containing protein [Richelia sp. SM1_7_0]NJN09189.1 DUF4386 domain-containing protein [Richelia sp. RM1_1_1]NJO30929.1 DUF4386 domain-containing protein [Richelia sp. SL_2_1]NJO58529.1 DUF4386 domain-containing protein [Richelia sp. RM2_1_2]
MIRLKLVRTTGILFILLVILSNIPYTLLIQTFGYDDILREPVEIVLKKFHAGGTQLILTWFAFGLTALLLTPVSILLHSVIDRNHIPYLPAITAMGALSGILQAIGLMRWVFVVPVLANLYTDPNTSATTQEAVRVVYQAVHQYGGVVIGEHLGQTLLIGWTLGIGLVMRSSPLFKSWVAWWGLFTTPLLLLGQSELLATVIPQMPVIETTPIGFILWEVWILIVGISLLRVPQKRLAS